MKDPQVNTKAAQAEVFLLSPVLHAVSLTVLVYLRGGFGYAFLRPKSFWLACSWAFTLYVVYAWIDGVAWREHRAIIWFGLGAMGLYWYHLAGVLRREWHGTGEHDYFSGRSNFDALLGGGGKNPRQPVNPWKLRLWGEPLAAFVAALLLRVVCLERHLSGWLLLVSFCLWGKEALNRWFGLRHHKRRQDIFEDAEQAFADQVPPASPRQVPPRTGMRKERVKRTRSTASSPGESEK